MRQKHTVLEKMQDQLRTWDQKIDELKAKSDVAQVELRMEYQQEITRLKEMRADLAERLERLRHAGESGWSEMEKGMDAAMNDFRVAFTKALSKFKHD